eukprot:689810-Prorocentrum_minimum.AAC.2
MGFGTDISLMHLARDAFHARPCTLYSLTNTNNFETAKKSYSTATSCTTVNGVETGPSEREQLKLPVVAECSFGEATTSAARAAWTPCPPSAMVFASPLAHEAYASLAPSRATCMVSASCSSLTGQRRLVSSPKSLRKLSLTCKIPTRAPFRRREQLRAAAKPAPDWAPEELEELEEGTVRPRGAVEQEPNVLFKGMTAFVAGASGGTGKEIVEQVRSSLAPMYNACLPLVNLGVNVVALVRDKSKATGALQSDKVTLVEGDVYQYQTLPRAMKGCNVVVCATGSRPALDPLGPFNVDYQGTKNLVTAALREDVKVRGNAYLSLCCPLLIYLSTALVQYKHIVGMGHSIGW